MSPHTKVTQKNQPVTWNLGAIEPFESFKQESTSSPTLVHANLAKPFILEVCLVIDRRQWIAASTCIPFVPFAFHL